jgi:hypothetical protein
MPEQLARLDASWQRTAVAGLRLLQKDAYPTDILRLIRLVVHEHGIQSDSTTAAVAAHIHGSSGSALVGGASTRPHDVGELEPAMLSMIADFASLALQ